MSKGIKVIIALLVVLCLAAGAYYVYQQNFFGVFDEKVKSFAEHLDEHNYQAAYTAFSAMENGEKAESVQMIHEYTAKFVAACQQEEFSDEQKAAYRGLDILKEYAGDTLRTGLNDAVKRCYNDIISVDKALAEISRIGSFDFLQAEFDAAKKQIKEKALSDKAYNDGLKAAQEGDYTTAEKYFMQVSKLDERRYNAAQTAISAYARIKKDK